MEIFEQQAKLFKILMHPARLAILDVLRNGEECVCHMEAGLGLRQAYISQQLMVLREAGLILDRRDGWNIFYRVIKPEIYAIIDAAHEFTGMDPGRKLKPRDQDEFDLCTCPRCRTRSGTSIS